MLHGPSEVRDVNAPPRREVPLKPAVPEVTRASSSEETGHIRAVTNTGRFMTLDHWHSLIHQVMDQQYSERLVFDFPGASTLWRWSWGELNRLIDFRSLSMIGCCTFWAHAEEIHFLFVRIFTSTLLWFWFPRDWPTVGQQCLFNNAWRWFACKCLLQVKPAGGQLKPAGFFPLTLRGHTSTNSDEHIVKSWQLGPVEALPSWKGTQGAKWILTEFIYKCRQYI